MIDAAGNNSATTTLASFIIDTVAPASSASISGATYTTPQSISLSCSDTTSGCSQIYYTTDGTTPTVNSQTYTTAISITSGYTVLKYFSADNAGNSETTIHTENYTVITGSVSFMAPTVAQTQTTVPGDNIKSPLPPLLKGENPSPPIIATVDQILSEAKQIVNLTNFINLGTDSTKILGTGERQGVINSFTSAFGKPPQTEI
ncbi:MAG: chitobiase/beta-hexosaminidase C-terminal domain-containing protein, partial [bacterium]|nr:chitobiase/beta-hexosaminidase C-terminal domain-containing protein [bacterium]